MDHSEFKIGLEFYVGRQRWRCTDVGTRTIAAIRTDKVTVERSDGGHRILDHAEAERDGWFRGPPYPVLELLFDEDDMEGCSREPDLTPDDEKEHAQT